MTMQNLVNAVKGTALGVAEYLTPVLKVCNAKIYLCVIYLLIHFGYVKESD